MAGYRPDRLVHAPTLLISALRSPNARVQHEWAAVLNGNPDVTSYDTDHYGLLRLPHVREIAGQVCASLVG